MSRASFLGTIERVFGILVLLGVCAFLLARSSLATTGSVVYSYDALGRLVMAGYDNGICIVYTYDANSNRQSETISISSSANTGTLGCFVWGQALWGN